MCNQTSLSNFLEGVTFTDQDMTDMASFDKELEESLLEDGGLLLFDMEDVDDSLLTVSKPQEGNASSSDDAEMNMDMDDDVSACQFLPEMELNFNLDQEDPELAALLSPPYEEDEPSAANNNNEASLEKLAQCMRQSEMALRQKFAYQQLRASNAQVFAKANPFFTGRRFTITPELEKSRQQVWSIIRAQQVVQQQNGTPTMTAAA